MADLKISALPAASLALAGTEVLPIVQSSATKQVTVANLTAGRAVATGNLIATANATSYPITAQGTSGFATSLKLASFGANGEISIETSEGGTPAQVNWKLGANILVNGVFDIIPSTTVGGATFSNPAIRITSTSDVNIKTGNLVIGTSGKGITLPGGITWTSGAGSPEGVVTAPVGSLFSRSDGGAGTSLYVKQSGSGNTGWAGK
jgi:hypothetical protein